MIRSVLVFILIIIVLFPLFTVLVKGAVFDLESWREIVYRPFLYAGKRSVYQVLGIAGIGSLVGVILGGFASFWKYPLKNISLVIISIPLVIPTFVSAIGIQSLQPFFNYSFTKWLDGYWGCIWAGLSFSIPISILVTFAAGLSISKEEKEIVLVNNGALTLVKYGFIRLFPFSLYSSFIASILFLSDSGSGQIMGYHGVSGDILVSFSAKNNFKMAAMKALLIVISILPVAFSACLLLQKYFSYQLLRQRLSGEDLPEVRYSVIVGAIYTSLCAFPVIAIFTGLVRPLLKPASKIYIEKAVELFFESVWTTIFYGAYGAVLAIVIAVMILNFLPKKNQPFLVAGSVALVVIPSCISGLGLIELASNMPVWLDFVFRSKLLVVVGMAIRLAPLAYIILYVMSLADERSPVETARVYGVKNFDKLWFIYAARWKGKISTCFIVIFCLILADVSTMNLLQPPGGASFGSHLFAVMDAASERVVAALCLVYITIPIVISIIFFTYKIIRKNAQY